MEAGKPNAKEKSPASPAKSANSPASPAKRANGLTRFQSFKQKIEHRSRSGVYATNKAKREKNIQAITRKQNRMTRRRNKGKEVNEEKATILSTLLELIKSHNKSSGKNNNGANADNEESGSNKNDAKSRNSNNAEEMAHDWYKIPEVEPADFVTCVKPMYRVLEGTHVSKSNEDTFLKAVICGYKKYTPEEWVKSERIRLAQKALEMKMGDFHEELMGKLPGWVTYPNGHKTGCDVGSTDGTHVLEIKNRDNTEKGTARKKVVDTLLRNIEEGRRASLVQINCPNGKVNRWNAPKSVDVWNGRQAYTFLSGRETFYDDLLYTLTHVFATFPTLASLKESLEIA